MQRSQEKSVIDSCRSSYASNTKQSGRGFVAGCRGVEKFCCKRQRAFVDASLCVKKTESTIVTKVFVTTTQQTILRHQKTAERRQSPRKGRACDRFMSIEYTRTQNDPSKDCCSVSQCRKLLALAIEVAVTQRVTTHNKNVQSRKTGRACDRSLSIGVTRHTQRAAGGGCDAAHGV